MDITSLGYVALITFGGVWFISLLVDRFLHKTLQAEEKFILSVAVALVVGFIPAELGNAFVTEIKDAIGIATALAGLYQGTARVLSRVGSA